MHPAIFKYLLALLIGLHLMSAHGEDSLFAKYRHIDRKKVISQALLSKALAFFDKNSVLLKNKSHLTVIDYSLNSRKRRMHVVDMKTGEVWSLHVAHGRGSDPEHDGILNSFSNEFDSNASSRGFFSTGEIYTGIHGVSLRLDGLSPTNSRARERALVLHSADYVKDADIVQGRSYGCIAVARPNLNRLLEKIKGGSLIYVDAQYEKAQ